MSRMTVLRGDAAEYDLRDIGPLQILYVHRTQGRGAEGVHISSIVREWEKMGHNVIIISPPGVDPLISPGDAPIDKSERLVRGWGRIWKTVSLKFPQPFFEILEFCYNFLIFPRVLIALLNRNVDLVYERYAFFMWGSALASRIFKIPHFLEVNELSGIDRARGLTFFRLCRMIERCLFRLTDRIFPVSTFLMQRIAEQGGDSNKIFVIPNAIDESVLEGNTKRKYVRRKYGIEKKVVIGFAGWFDEWDMLDILIELYGDYWRGEDTFLFIIGDGKNATNLKKHTVTKGLSGHVMMTGPVPRNEIFDYLDAIDIPVFTHSNAFGSPVVLFEFMGLGKAVVAPSLLPFTDVIRDGWNGVLFTRLEFRELAKVVSRLVSDQALRESIGRNARDSIKSMHTWKTNSVRILSHMKDFRK